MVEDLKKVEFGFKLYNKLVSKYPTLLTLIDNENNNKDKNEEEKNIINYFVLYLLHHIVMRQT